MAATAAVCPWSFLCPSSDSPRPINSAQPPPIIRKSFAQALSNSCDIPLSQLPKPCVKGDAISIKISEEEYQQGLRSCKNNLHGRLVLTKGSKPVTSQELREKLLKLWKPIDNWKLIPLGKGYYEFIFASVEDLRSVWTVGSWNLQPGLLRLYQWSPDFNPSTIRQTHAQVWIRITDLPLEYWRPKILFEIASCVGTPIALDVATKNRTLGHFARVLVDLDLSAKLHSEILVERESFAFFVGISFERLPPFCTFCKTVGHGLEHCKKESFHQKHKPHNGNQSLHPGNQVHSSGNSSENFILPSKSTEPYVQSNPSTVRQKSPEHFAFGTEQINASENHPDPEANEVINERNEVVPSSLCTHDNSGEVQDIVVAPDTAAGLSINVSLQDYALQPLVHNDIRALSKCWADMLDNNSEEDISNSVNAEDESGNSHSFQLVLSKSQKQKLKTIGKQQQVGSISSFPEVVQKDLQILSKFWGDEQDEETDMAANNNLSAATASNSKTQRKRLAKNKKP